MEEKEYICDTDHLILWFENADEAVAFAKDIEIVNCAWEEIYKENRGDEAWIYVLAICDICKERTAFFVPAEIYEDGISAIECFECGNMSVYPEEGNWNDEI